MSKLKPRLRVGRVPWLEGHASSAVRFPKYRGTLSADVVIVGGGITGALTAYAFSEAGVRVVLLDAARIGRGSTAASTALLMQEPDTDFRELARRYGRSKARRFWEAIGSATDDLVSLLKRLKISCNLRMRDSIYYTLSADEAADLRKEAAARRSAGLEARWLSGAAVRRRTGLAAAGGILMSGNAQLNPYDACIGILRHAVERGARVFEYSRARRVEVVPDGVEVKTEAGSVRARWVLVTTGYATAEFKPLAGRFRMLNTYVIATEPLSGNVRRQLGAGDVMTWDTDRPYHYMRWTEDRRILFGGADKPHGPGRSRHDGLQQGRDRLRRALEHRYPVLAGRGLDYAWEGLFAQTPDGLPYIGTHRRYPRHLFALGYGGNGMSVAYLAAKILLRRYSGTPAVDDQLFAFRRTR
jgi:glycine/D-amino acid oxidase-like deaminating enzyme